MADSPLDRMSRQSESSMRRLRSALRRALGVQIGRRSKIRLPKRFDPKIADPAHVAAYWHKIAGVMLRFGGASAGNEVKLFTDGDETFEALWGAIDHAKRRIWFESYTIEPDKVGLRTIEHLAKAAQRGCEVVLIYDAVGSSAITETHLKSLREAGAEIECFNPLLRWTRTMPLLRRDHRKIIVIDDAVGFCGGMNISELYAGKEHGTACFRDCHARLGGPCARDLAAVFLSTLRLVRRSHHPPPRALPASGESFVQVLGSRGYQGRRSIQRSLRISISGAVQTCLITTPYFVPPRKLTTAMTKAAERGVDVQLLTAGFSDVPIVRRAGRHVYGVFLRKGVRIHEMFDCMLHAKTITIDGVYGTVGSFNLDRWSDQRNLEVNVAIIDRAVAKELEEQFAENLRDSKEVTLETWGQRRWWTRVIDWVCYQLLRL